MNALYICKKIIFNKLIEKKKFYEILNKEIWRHDDQSSSSHVKCFSNRNWFWIRNIFFNDILGINAIKLCNCNVHVESWWPGHFSSYWSLHICGWHNSRQMFLSKFEIIISNSKSYMHDRKHKFPIKDYYLFHDLWRFINHIQETFAEFNEHM